MHARRDRERRHGGMASLRRVYGVARRGHAVLRRRIRLPRSYRFRWEPGRPPSVIGRAMLFEVRHGMPPSASNGQAIW